MILPAHVGGLVEYFMLVAYELVPADHVALIYDRHVDQVLELALKCEHRLRVAYVHGEDVEHFHYNRSLGLFHRRVRFSLVAACQKDAFCLNIKASSLNTSLSISAFASVIIIGSMHDMMRAMWCSGRERVRVAVFLQVAMSETQRTSTCCCMFRSVPMSVCVRDRSNLFA